MEDYLSRGKPDPWRDAVAGVSAGLIGIQRTWKLHTAVTGDDDDT